MPSLSCQSFAAAFCGILEEAAIKFTVVATTPQSEGA